MVQQLREEFRFQSVSLRHPDYSSFSKSKWMSPTKYLIYRWVLAIFFIVSILLDREYFGRWYTGYFTGWGLATITIYVSLYAFLCSYQFYKSRTNRNISLVTENNNGENVENNKEELHTGIVWGYRFVWMLFNIAAVNSMIVTLGYWGALHSKYGGKSLKGRIGYHNLTAHLVNAIVMLLEAVVTPLPVRILHFVYSNIYGLLYITSSIIFWLVNGKTFYYFLDYSNRPGLAVITIVVGFVILQPLLQLFFYGIYRFREWLLTRICSRTGAAENAPAVQSHVITAC